MNWTLWRMDDHGHRAVVARFATEQEALEAMEAYERKGHKQSYWLEPTGD